MTEAAPFIERLLGTPWRCGAKGPDAFDCWGLVQHVQRELAGRIVLDAADPPVKPRDLIAFIDGHPARKQWVEVERPVHLGAVLMAHVSHPAHVGTYLQLDGGVILHAQFSTGVTVDSILALRNSGWRRLRFYDWIG